MHQHPELQASVSGERRRPRGLVIDDETAVRDLMREFLRSLGFDADGAATGPEGLALFEGAGYDLVVTDLMMPGMTGWEVVEAVRRRAPTIGVIMVTGSAGNLDTDRAHELRLPLLAKPVRLEEFRRAVAQALRSGAEASTQETAVDPLGSLRTILDGVRKMGGQLEILVCAVEALVRERDELRAEHEATVRALSRARAEHQVLSEERQKTVDALETIRRRLGR